MPIPPNKILSTKTLYNGRIVNLHIDEILLKDGTTGIREIVDHEECSIILPYLENVDKIIFIEQYRDAAQSSLLELPAGMIRSDENPEEAAKRELQEETGYMARSLIQLGSYFTSPGFTNEKHYLFLATQIDKVSDVQDNLEIGNCQAIPRRKVFDMIQKGEIVDGKTILAIFWGERHLKKI